MQFRRRNGSRIAKFQGRRLKNWQLEIIDYMTGSIPVQIITV